MKKKFVASQIILALMFVSLVAMNNSRNTSAGLGELQGKILDASNNNGIPFASVVLMKDSITIVKGTTSDLHGNYLIKDITPGTYSLKIKGLSYNTSVLNGIIIPADKISIQNVLLSVQSKALDEIIVSSPKLVDPDHTSTGSTVTHEEIQQMSINRSNPNNIAAQSAGVYKNISNGINVNGTRWYNQEYYVDGATMSSSYSKSEEKIFESPIYAYEDYASVTENPFKKVKDDPLSTFSIDVDNASYTNIRRYLNEGSLPPQDAVRIEEFINYFHYDYSQPKGEDPFSISTEISDCPWNKDHRLISIGLQGKKIPLDNLPPANLVFLIDVSGSMMDYNKLPLVKNCFKLLVNQLRQQDKVAIVVYAGNAGEVLSSTSGDNKQKILDAIDDLEAGGSTAGGEGILLAYKVAKENFKSNGNNRVILATDGDFNVGVSSGGDLEHLIESKRDDGIFLSVLGFGMGNYKDSKMETLADKGNGNYSYIDNFSEGKKVFVEQLGGTLFTIAKDVKLQLEFNPNKVKSYRLIGYENRMLNKEDFNNDKKDAGEMGSGHTVTALYEIIPADSKEETSIVDPLKYMQVKPNEAASCNEVLTVKFRYKKPNENVSKLIEVPLIDSHVSLENTSENFRFASAVAEFGLLLKNSSYKNTATYEQVIALAKQSKGSDEEGYRSEFIKLVDTASKIDDSNKLSKK